MWKLIASLLLTFTLLQGKCPCQSDPDPEYIVYLRPGGVLGGQLAKFWASVKKNKLNDPPVLTYPPHVSLTGFFPGNAAQEEEFIAALRESIDRSRPISVKIAGKKVTQGPKLDYIPISSPDLLTVTTDFVKLIGVSTSYIKGKPKTFGYHISLRSDTNEKTTLAVRKLEAQFIHLNAKNIKKTTWAVYLYRKENKQLEELVKIPIN